MLCVKDELGATHKKNIKNVGYKRKRCKLNREQITAAQFNFMLAHYHHKVKGCYFLCP